MDETQQKPPVIPSESASTYILVVTLLQYLSFWLINILLPEWQSGKASDYAILLLSPKASWIIFPFIIYSSLCLFFLIENQYKNAQKFFIRLGIYTGVVISVQFCILVLVAFSYYVLIAWVVPFIFNYLLKWISRHWGVKAARLAIYVMLILFLIVVGFFAWKSDLSTVMLMTVILAVSAFFVSVPFWTFLIMVNASLILWKYYESFSDNFVMKIIGILTWIMTYSIALRINFLKMYELYAALPPQPPDCYIATAAAKGHSRFVRSWTVQLANGKSMQINRQLQRLKAVEIAWMAVSSTSHGWMRFVYDVVGKYLAKFIRNPILADISYLLLIPIERISFFVLKWIIPDVQSISDRLYLSSTQGDSHARKN